MAKVVIFTENNARILCNPPNIEDYKRCANALIDPDLKAVAGVPPHLWKLIDGKAVIMDAAESKTRNTHIAIHGVINTHTPKISLLSYIKYYQNYIYLIFGASAGSLITYFLLTRSK